MKTFEIKVNYVFGYMRGFSWEEIIPSKIDLDENTAYTTLLQFIDIHNKLQDDIEDKILEIRFVPEGGINGNYVSCDYALFAEAIDLKQKRKEEA